MFLCKFQQVTNTEIFNADKNGNMPFIGDLIAGTATGTIFNGTMFQREGLLPNKVYLCDNFVDEDYPDNVQTRVISEVSLLELQPLMTQLGAPKLNRDSDETPE